MPGHGRDSGGYYHQDDSNDERSGRSSHDWVDAVETRFPSSNMYYQSDAQRSDTATVCSGSVIEDIEVESVLSQEDTLLQGKPLATGPKLGNNDPSQVQREGNHLVDFADAASADHHSMMGPPLNRTLLLLQEYAGLSSHATTHSLKSYGSGSDTGGTRNNTLYSDDCESNHSQDDETSILFRDDMTAPTSEALKLKDQGEAVQTPERRTSSRVDSVKSYGSNCGSAADTDDCGGSLDVETHSVGTRSIHSQDEAMPPTMPLAETESDSVVPTLSSAPVENGRRSPGGTIYKGRGIRRYQGRYMHLPLKRFHQNGVHLDEHDDHVYERLPVKSSLPKHVGQDDMAPDAGLLHGRDSDAGEIHPDWNDPRQQQRQRLVESARGRFETTIPYSAGTRNRSRSRSPPASSNREDDFHDDDDDDRKPRARR
jgi:hypothetical protein